MAEVNPEGTIGAPINNAVQQSNASSRHRAWCFTTNNYTDETLVLMRDLPCKYLVYGKEVSPTTGTPHLQGYVVLNSAKTRTALARLIPRSNLEVARGDSLQNFTYCSKEGDFIELGDRPRTPAERGQMEVDRWDAIWIAASTGNIMDIPSQVRIRCYPTLRRIERDFMPQVAQISSVCGTWIHGPSGCGKTRAVVDQFPSAYPKMLNKWWDGYQEEEIVYLDDVDPTQSAWLARYLKIWADRYAFIAEIKGGSRKIRPRRFIVTSQYTIGECFTDEPTREALNRRFTSIEKVLGQNIIV